MNRVIKNVLQITRRQQSKPEEIELSHFLMQFKQDFCVMGKCNITLKLPNHKKNIIFDKSQLEQVLVILCENALQHGKDEKGKVHITISFKSKSNKTLLTIHDSGLGVRADIRSNVFDPFFSTLRTGSGMGLFIAKDLCEINQARLNLDPTSEGCSFTITLTQGNEIRL